MSKEKDNTALIAILGIGALGAGAYFMMNKKSQQPVYYQPQQPVYQQPQAQPQLVYQAPKTTTPTIAPAPAQKQNVVQKASGIVSLVGDGINLVKGLFRKKSVNGLGNLDAEGYYLDEATGSIVITDPVLYDEVIRQMAGQSKLQGFSGEMM
jgi:hypothetical protein